MKRSLFFAVLVFLLLNGFSAHAQKLSPAPDFSAVDASDKTIKLSDFKGKNVVLVFYVDYS